LSPDKFVPLPLLTSTAPKFGSIIRRCTKEKRLTRKIIVLSDGTGNSAGKVLRTNVWRVYQALDLSSVEQIARYDDGVGTSKFKPLAIIGGAVGWGLKRNILDLYTFLCRNYQSGDEIFGFGFSRGAFTVRVLIKFVLSEGLVRDFSSQDELYSKARVLYRRFRRSRTTKFKIEVIGRLLRDSVLWLWNVLTRFSIPTRPKTRKIKRIKFLGGSRGSSHSMKTPRLLGSI
jgi:hypothetical protein